MKAAKLLTLLLALALLVCCMLACGDDGDGSTTTTTDNPAAPPPAAPPTTAEEYIAYALSKMETEKYEEEEIKTKHTTVTGQPAQSSTETSFSVSDGKNFSIRENGYSVTYFDGMMYFHYPQYLMKSKCHVSEADLSNPDFEFSNEDAAWFQKIKFNSFTLETDESGNKKTVGRGASAEAETVLRELFAEIATPSGIVFDYDSIYWEATFDSEYRLVSQKASVSITATSSGITIASRLDSEYTYRYGEEYTVKAPADADAYTLKPGFEDLMTP